MVDDAAYHHPGFATSKSRNPRQLEHVGLPDQNDHLASLPPNVSNAVFVDDARGLGQKLVFLSTSYARLSIDIHSICLRLLLAIPHNKVINNAWPTGILAPKA